MESMKCTKQKKMIHAFIGFRLSKNGQRDAILRHQPAEQDQTLVVEIPEECVDLFKITRNGVLVGATAGNITYVGSYAIGDGVHSATSTVLDVRDVGSNLPRFEILTEDVELDHYPDDWAEIYRIVLEKESECQNKR